jgi:peroxiredoxin
MRILRITALSLVLSVLGCAGRVGSTTAPPQTSPFDSTPATPSIAVTPEMGSPHLGDFAPDFELTDQDGKKVSLASLHGSVVLLAFVTSWCPFSEAEQPHLARLAEDYRGKNVKVVAVVVKEDEAGYRKYVGRAPTPFGVLHDTSGEVVRSYTPAKAQPEIKDRSLVLITSNLVIDQEGRVAFFTMADTLHFDAKLVHARRTIDELLEKERRPPA